MRTFDHRGGLELRLAPASAGKLTASDGKTDGAYSIAGYAAVFNSAAQIGTSREVIRPGAFKRSLKERPDLFLLHSHDAGRPLARTPRTLTVSEDAKGLRFVARLLPTAEGKNVFEQIRAGIIDKMSFSFHIHGPAGDRWTRDDKGGLRELLDLDLVEVSLVAWPAYQATSVGAQGTDSDTPSTGRGSLADRLRARERAIEIPPANLWAPGGRLAVKVQIRERQLALNKMGVVVP